MESTAKNSRSPRPRFIDIGAVHLFVLWNFAIVQPAFDRLAANPTFLKDLRIERITVLLFVLLLCVMLPGMLVALERTVSLFRPRAGRWLHDLLFATLVAATILPLLARFRFVPGMVHVTLAVLISVSYALAGRRYPWMRLPITLASPAVLVFPGWLLFLSAISQQLFPKSTAAEVSVHNPLPVVMVVLDEFSGAFLLDGNGGIDRERFPNFAALARETIWFRNATSVHPYTAYAVPAILTGKYQNSDRRSDVADHPINLFTLLIAARSHEMIVFESASRLFPDNADPDNVYPPAIPQQIANLGTDLAIVYLHHLAPVDLRMALPMIPRRWFGLITDDNVRPEKRTGVIRYSWDRDRDRQFDHFMSCVEPSDRRRFYYLHLVLPHYPWNFLPSGRKYRHDTGLGEELYGTSKPHQERWSSDEHAITQGMQRYMLQIGYVDHLLGRLIEHLKSIDLYDQCLFILTADHGVSFRPGVSRRTPSDENVRDLLHIPLFIKPPGHVTGVIDDRNAENIDLLPTIADVLDLNPAIESDGQSLLDAHRVDRVQKRFFTGSEYRTIDSNVQQWLATLPPLVQRFHAQPGWEGVFRIGPYGTLAGKRLTDLKVAGRSEVAITLTKWNASDYEAAEELVPCIIEGRASHPARNRYPIPLAIAINGTVRATTRTYEAANARDVWLAIVPEESFQPGKNLIQLFEIRDDGTALSLLECDMSP